VETLILLVDTIAMMVVVYFSLKNEKLPEGAPETGFFRIRGPDKPAEPKEAEPLKARRSRRL
jgi:hypothetical protein